MLDKNGKRMLAYVQQIVDIEPLFFCKKDKKGNIVPDLNENGEKIYANAIEKAHVLGWTLIVNKGEFKPGDKCVFFEIDSKIPEHKFLESDGTDVFEFLKHKHYTIKTYKLNKFGIHSQGLAMPLSKLGLSADLEINTDLTEQLGITYAVSEDNQRKSSTNKKRKKCWLFNLFRKQQNFPSNYVSKTDEERIQNMPWVLENKEPLIATEKIDGTSTTFLLVKKLFWRFDFYVCSRNRRLTRNDLGYNAQDNIYWEMAIKYDIKKQLKKYLKSHRRIKWVCIQGESYGEGWQGNPLKLSGHHFAAFNFKDSKNGRWNSIKAKELLNSWEKPIPWVPILNERFILPDTVEELLTIATGKSSINPNVLREGIVFRAEDGVLSFKAVSPEYLELRKE